MQNIQPNAKRDPEGVRQNILEIATEEFANNGLSGARIDEISARTRTSKRMIYYYFGDKESLYNTCLETAYKNVRSGESQLNLDGQPPYEALKNLVAFTFDHHRQNPDFIRLVMIENIHNANYVQQSDAIKSTNESAIDKLAEIIKRGQETGIFRSDLDPVELHWHISALSFFNVSNRATFSALFGDILYTAPRQNQLRDHAVEMILKFVTHKDTTHD
jgi:AcrR family transcriptional regulator